MQFQTSSVDASRFAILLHIELILQEVLHSSISFAKWVHVALLLLWQEGAALQQQSRIQWGYELVSLQAASFCSARGATSVLFVASNLAASCRGIQCSSERKAQLKILVLTRQEGAAARALLGTASQQISFLAIPVAHGCEGRLGSEALLPDGSSQGHQPCSTFVRSWLNNCAAGQGDTAAQRRAAARGLLKRPQAEPVIP